MENQNLLSDIKGWGADLDPKDRPAYPMERIPARDIGVHWTEIEPQEQRVRIFRSMERPHITRIFGSTVPPRGLSGKIRKKAYALPEAHISHWLLLLMADRVDMVEGVIEDLKSGHIPNIYKEMGLKAEWKHNKIGFLKRVVIPTALIGLTGYMLTRPLFKSRPTHT